MSATKDAGLPSFRDSVQSASPAVQPAILRLPRELRDLIYEYYLRIEGGYTYDYGSNKLREADGSPISIALTASCRQIASELRGLPFRLNTITFSTYCSETTQQDAGLFHSTVRSISMRKRMLIRRLVPRLFTQDMVLQASQKFPQFSPVFDQWQPGRQVDFLLAYDFTGGEARSVWEDFMQLIFTLLSKHPEFFSQVKVIPRYWTECKGCDVFELRDARPEPWSIPDTIELQRLMDIVEIGPERPTYRTGTRYCYSAVQIALRFLHSIPTMTREMIRKVVLLEDRESVAHPQCHGRGLVALCRTQKDLRIERVVSLWRNAFPIAQRTRSRYIIGSRDGDDVDTLRDDRLRSATISQAIGSWIAEVLALPSFGMPQGSYNLVFDGAPNLEQASGVFQVVQRDAAWQSALDAAYANGMLPVPSWTDRRERFGYVTEHFPDVVRNLATKDAPIRCNFGLGTPWNVDELLQEHRGWSDDDWAAHWNAHEPSNFQTESPLPPWHILRWSYVLSY